MTAVLDTQTLNAEAILQTFLEMVQINSPSGEEEQMCAYLSERFAALQQHHQLTQYVDMAGNLIVDIPKRHCDHDSVLVLSGHLDVVPPCLDIKPVVEHVDGDTIVSSDNTTVLGADDKAGLTPILEAVAFVLENDLPRPATRLLLTTNEEVGLDGSKALSDEAIKADFALTFDHTGKQGVIIHRAPTLARYRLECRGKSVHAGIMPEQGVNAIMLAAKIIERVNQAGLTGRIDEDTTGNLGLIRGGKATNIVPDLLVLEGEFRSHNPETVTNCFDTLEQFMNEELANFPGAEASLHRHISCHAYQIPSEHPGMVRVKQAMTAIGVTPQLISTNGGSDNNVFVKRGLEGLVLSCGFVEPHSLKERVRLSEMVTCTRLIVQFMAEFSKEKF